MIEQLSGVLRPEPAHDWLFTPNPLLDNHKPVDLLRDGQYRQVLGAVDALAEGTFVCRGKRARATTRGTHHQALEGQAARQTKPQTSALR